MLVTSIPEAEIVSITPKVELFEKASINGADSVWMKPMKNVKTDVIIIRTNTPLLLHMTLQPSLNSLINDFACSYFLDTRPLRTARVERTVMKYYLMNSK